MTKLNIIFDIIQGHQITDRELYYSECKIPVFTGNNEIKGHWNQSIIKESNLPCLTYPTKGNAGVAFVQENVFDANNTAVLIPKDEWREKIVLDWFRFKLPPLFLEAMTSKSGVSYLNKDIVKEIDIEIPKKDKQLREIQYYQKLEKMKKELEKILHKVDDLLAKGIT